MCNQIQHDDFRLFQITITGGGNGRCLAEFVVRPEHLNGGGGLHGGFTATVVDNFTTYALLTWKDCHPGVTVDLHVRYFNLSEIISKYPKSNFLFEFFQKINYSYLGRASEGDTIVVDAQAIKAGKSMAFLDCVLRKKEDDTIIAKGTQTKFIGFNK